MRMQPLLNTLFGAILVQGLATAALAQPVPWRSAMAGAVSVQAPDALFANDEPQPNAGRKLTTADGRASLILQSYQGNTRSPRVFLQSLKPPSGIIYQRVTPRFFVVSSFRGGKIWYNRCNFAGATVGCALLSYPATEKRAWDRTVTRISRTLSVR